MKRTVILAAILVASIGWSAATAHAQHAAADTSFSDFLEALSDSTDTFFGTSAAPVDTAGLDSALIARLANPQPPRPIDVAYQWFPWSWFNRVDGPVYGDGLTISHSRLGEVSGVAAYSVGQKVWLGGAHYRKTHQRGKARWAFEIGGGRGTTVMDRLRARFGSMSVVRALFAGSDSRFYMREDGWTIYLERETPVWRARLTYNDYQQSPLEVTARWNLFDKRTRPDFNTPAAVGRNRELQAHLVARAPLLPIYLAGDYHASLDAIGSDFEYRRFQVAAAAELSARGIGSLLPQFIYGRATGTVTPQAAFYLGGSRTLRTVDGSRLGGSGLTLARVDLIGQPDILELLRIPHPAAFPLQLGAFFASGAVWGDDPYGGPTRPGTDWPHQQDWKNEIGIEALYRPGIPKTDGLLRFSYGWPLGPRGERRARYTISYSQPMDLIDRPGRD